MRACTCRTRKQTRFWGWGSKGRGSWGWGSLRVVEPERPFAGLAEWLRLAHARLDRNAAELPGPSGAPTAILPALNSPAHDSPEHDAPEYDAQENPRGKRKIKFVCNRRFVGWVIR